MNRIWIRIRPLIRGLYRILSALNGFCYDFKRFLNYGGWKENLKDIETRNYNSVMAYHGLEKSLSYKNRNPKSGWGNAERVFSRLKVANATGEFGFHDKAAKQVLAKFLGLPANSGLKRSEKMIKEIDSMNFESSEIHGAIEYPKSNFKKGILGNPEDFFFSRYSLREFSKEKISDQIVERAVKLALKTPSVCNRHEWHIYHGNDRVTIDKALYFQNGNRPFGERIPNLLVVTTDLKAFFVGAEHYQHWIDGGLISMSLIYAFHSLGIACCPLNWCQPPKKDKEFRKAFNIKPHQTVIMMIAFGYPDDENRVCSSSRRPLNEIFSKLKQK